jgi:hypothetical protein
MLHRLKTLIQSLRRSIGEPAVQLGGQGRQRRDRRAKRTLSALARARGLLIALGIVAPRAISCIGTRRCKAWDAAKSACG